MFFLTVWEITQATIKTQVLNHVPSYLERDERRIGGGVGVGVGETETGDIRGGKAEEKY